ncbi:MAG: hypothetical protein Q8O00_13490 [Holophaga sp.]|nr:hypothetical protein [Holophaga sp.]
MLWLPILIGVWGLLAVIASTQTSEKVEVGVFASLFCLAWYLSRRHTEKGWRITSDLHLVVLMRSGKALDLGAVTALRPVQAEDFERFQSKSFFSLRFPMLKFKHKQVPTYTGVVGNLPCVMTFGLCLPVYLGVAYASFSWGTISLESGTDVTLLVSTSPNQSWLVTAYTPEAVQLGLDMFSASETQ